MMPPPPPPASGLRCGLHVDTSGLAKGLQQAADMIGKFGNITRLQAEVAELKRQNTELQKRNYQLEHELRKWKK